VPVVVSLALPAALAGAGRGDPASVVE